MGSGKNGAEMVSLSIEALERRVLLSQYGLDGSFGDHGTAAAFFPDGIGFQLGLIMALNDQSTLLGGVVSFPYPVVPNYSDTRRIVLVRFAEDGRIISKWAAPLDVHTAVDMARQDDGKIVMAGMRLADGVPEIVARFTADGEMDTTFAGDGVVDLNFDIYPEHYEILDMALDAEGRVLVMGRIGMQVAPWTDAWSITCITPSGQLDPSFGDGGVARIAGGAPDYILAQPGGKIIAMNAHGLTRFTATGALDTTFGDNGVALFPQLPTYGRSATMLPDGRILLNAMDKVARITKNGRLDTTFGDDGIATILEGVSPQFPRSFVAADGSITVIDVYAVAKLTANGQPDPSFGISGRLNNYTNENREPYIGIVPSAGWNFALASNGDVLMSGACNPPAARLARFEAQTDVFLDVRGVLSITGSDQKDTISITSSEDDLTVVRNGVKKTFALRDVIGIDLLCGDGDDNISIQAPLPATISGGDGDDTLAGGSGNDSIDGGLGHNVVHAGAGNDTIFGGADGELLDGGKGNDRFMSHFDEPTGEDTIYGGDGNDSLASTGTVPLLIYCGAGADTIRLGSGNDTVYGDDGNDHIMPGAGDNLVYGGAGNDTILALDGRDTLWGGIGYDWIRGGWGNDLINGGAGKDRLWGNPGNDHIYGRRGNDALDGGSGNDVLVGGEGIDKLYGQDENDYIFARDGNAETIYGGMEDDWCEHDDLIDVLLDIETPV